VIKGDGGSSGFLGGKAWNGLSQHDPDHAVPSEIGRFIFAGKAIYPPVFGRSPFAARRGALRAREKETNMAQDTLLTVEQAVAPSVALVVDETARIDARDGWFLATLPFEEAQAPRQILRLGAEVEVLSPPALRDAVLREARAAVRLHRTQSSR
jgi:hypothetical protein